MGRLNVPESMRHATYAYENCPACGLNTNSKLQLFGRGNKRILLLFQQQESIQQVSKRYCVGEKFQFVKDALADFGVSIAEDCWSTSIIQCYAAEPKLCQAQHCAPAINRIIKQLQPKMVIAFGEFPPKTILGSILSGASVDTVHGFVHYNRELNTRVMFTYAPHSSVNGKRVDAVDDIIIKRDIKKAILALNEDTADWKSEMSCIKMLSDANACTWLYNEVENKDKRFAAFDYETNCLRPYNANSKIYCVSIATDVNNVVVLNINSNTEQAFKKWLETDHIKKISHNSAFERAWSIVKLGVNPHKLMLDTVLLAHVLDNRDIGWLSIKFLAPLLTGVHVWNGHIESFLKPNKDDEEKHGSYAINNIHELTQNALLGYCGIDSLVEYRVAKLLIAELKNFYESF